MQGALSPQFFLERDIVLKQKPAGVRLISRTYNDNLRGSRLTCPQKVPPGKKRTGLDHRCCATSVVEKPVARPVYDRVFIDNLIFVSDSNVINNPLFDAQDDGDTSPSEAQQRQETSSPNNIRSSLNNIITVNTEDGMEIAESSTFGVLRREKELNSSVDKTFTAVKKVSAVTVKFKVNYETKLGQTVKIVGSSPELGEWDVSKALEMKWNNGHDWTCSTLMQITKQHEFKFVVCNEDGGVLRWEDGPNRKLDGSNCPASLRFLRLDLAWNATSGVIDWLPCHAPIPEAKIQSPNIKAITEAPKVDVKDMRGLILPVGARLRKILSRFNKQAVAA